MSTAAQFDAITSQIRLADDAPDLRLALGHTLIALASLADLVLTQQETIERLQAQIDADPADEPGADMIDTYARLKEQHAARIEANRYE